MKTKLVALIYRGTSSVDPRFSGAMIPWCINDIRSLESYNKISVGIENGALAAYNSDFELQFSHNLKYVVGICSCTKVTQKNCSINSFTQVKMSNSLKWDNSNFMEFIGHVNAMVYLIKDPKDPLLHIFLFESNDSVTEMAELMQQMREPVKIGGSVGSIPQTFGSAVGDSSLSCALRRNNVNQSTPASNLKLIEALKCAQHDSSPSLNSGKMSASKSYTHGLSNSAGTVNHIPTSSSAQAHLSLLGDISPNHTHFFEVMYVGKIRVSHKRVPYTFIDDAIPKFKAYDAQKIRMRHLSSSRTASFNSDNGSVENISIRTTSVNEDDEIEENLVGACENNEKENIEINKVFEKDDQNDEEKIQDTINFSISTTEQSLSDRQSVESVQELKIVEEYESKDSDSANNDSAEELNKEREMHFDENRELQKSVNESTSRDVQFYKKLIRGQSQILISANPEVPKPRNRSASYGSIPPYSLVEQNRTMVFLVGRSDLRLISPDRKQVLLHKNFKDVASCAQGHKNGDHFGIICRESTNDGHNNYIGYVFKCQSDHVCDDIVSAISQAFITCSEQKQKDKTTQIFSCEHCPMLWYHKLCSDLEGLNDKKTQLMIFKRIETLTDDEQDIIWAKYYGAEKTNAHNLSEQNQFLMMLLRAHCEARQQRHVHDTAENRSEFLNQYLGGSTIFMKAKRSLTSSFDHLLKRKPSKDDIVYPNNSSSSTHQQHNKDSDVINVDSQVLVGASHRPRSNTWGSTRTDPDKPIDQLKSPMMDIFMKVGNSSKESKLEEQSSWRQAILNSVVTPSKNLDNATTSDFMSPMRLTESKKGKRSKEEIRGLWKTAIIQTILLNRMEKENAILQARQNENEIKKIKLDYDEICPCDKMLIERWEIIIGTNSTKIVNKKDPKVLLGAIKNGVPRPKRGDVWSFLADQYSMNTAPIDKKKYPNFNTPYYTLLKNLTEHQHAIFIDLGRTFPNHKYYKDPLGVGQLSLFNLLKAYSILDPELGYCQGLGFICGILLLHCDEENAFQLLKHLMFRRKMRTKYLPDMKKFQLELYQLSRLVKDYLPDLYDWLDKNDVSPTLYAAPWILTVFSSQFPLGFVARVFDLLFLESSEVIFKAALSLLIIHKEELLMKDNFEDIMDYFKNKIPNINANMMEKIMKEIFSLNINKQLTEYQVEYNVLQEEISTREIHLDLLNKEKVKSNHLETQLQFAQSSIAQLEKTRASQQSQISSLQSHVQTLELTIQTLGRYVSNIIKHNIDLELPNDVIRIMQQLDDIERQRKKPMFLERKINKSVSVNSNLGYPLKVLEELNETQESTPKSSPQKKKPQFFNNTYEQIRQRTNHPRPNRLLNSNSISSINEILHEKLENSDINTEKTENKHSVVNDDIASPHEIDSGYSTTPISPLKFKEIQQAEKSLNNCTSSLQLTQQIVSLNIPSEFPKTVSNQEMHPLSMCGDVSVRFHGTTQLKSIRPVHSRQQNTNKAVSLPSEGNLSRSS